MSDEFEDQDIEGQELKDEKIEEEWNGVFDLTLQEVPVKLKDPKDGITKEYTLREITGEERDKYLSGMRARMRFDKSGNPVGLSNFDGLYANLITLCLFDVEGKPVAPKVIQKWPARVQSALFVKAQKMSGLDKEAAEAAKNV